MLLQMAAGPQSLTIAVLAQAWCDTVFEHADHWDNLDQAIGDGDHGTNLRRGFLAIEEKLDELSTLSTSDACVKLGETLLMSVGGASGPLFATFFMETGKALAIGPAGEQPAFAFARAIDAVAARGRSDVGHKTLLDVLYPTLAAYGQDLTLVQLKKVVESAIESTRNMKAQSGRAAFVGARSVGHIDPGAASVGALIIAALNMMDRKK